MKVIVLALVCLAAVTANPIKPVNLDDDLQDFLKLVPIDKITDIVVDYILNDPEVQSLVEYAQSEDFKNLVLRVEAVPGYIDFINYLEDSGVHAYAAINELHRFLGLDPLERQSLLRRGTGLRGMIDDIIAILPLEELRALFDEKLATSPDFQNLVKRVQSPEFQAILDQLRNDEEYQKVLEDLKSRGVDVDKVIELLRDLFGVPGSFSFKPLSLYDDFLDFVKLIPIDQIEAIAIDYVLNDAEVQSILAYAQSEDFKNLVLRVEAVQGYIEFINYLDDSGLPVYDIINQLHGVIGLPPLERQSLLRRGTGLRGMIDDIIAILPLDELRALFDEKLATSPDFQNLVKRVQSPEFQALLDQLRNDEEYQKVLEDLNSKGIDVDKIIELLRDLFGVPGSFSFKPLSLYDDFLDFVKLIPIDQIEAIAIDYVLNDAEVQSILAYAQSEDFKNLVLRVEAVQGYIEFINYLDDSGLPVYDIINQLHGVIGLPPLERQSLLRRGTGLRGMIDDIIAILPLDELRALFDEKLATSPDFQNLVKRVQSPEFQALLDQLRNDEEYQKVLEDLNSKGIDVDKIIELLRDLFGVPGSFSFKPLSLYDDFLDFVKLIPIDQIEAIAIDYVLNDAEVQSILAYAQSEDFKNLVLRVEAVQGYIEFINYLDDSGLPVYDIINQLHGVIGLPPLERQSLLRRGTGLRGMIDDIIAILPLDELRALFDEKLATSPDFQNLVKRVQSPEFQALLDQLRNDEEYQKVLEDLNSKGIDVDKIIELLRDLFGVPGSFSFKPLSLYDDFLDFVKLIPIDQIEAIAIDYVLNDAEVQSILAYAQSEDFKNLVLRVEAVQGYIEFINYLDDSGLPVYDIINQIHGVIGLPPLERQSHRRISPLRGTGLRGMIDDIIAILPLDELRALFDEKLATSTDFQNLVNRIKSPEFQSLLDQLRNDVEYQKVLDDLKSKGIDVDKVIELLHDLFGVH